MAMWQRLVTFKNCYDFAVLTKVTKKRKVVVIGSPSKSDRREADMSLTLITSKPRSFSPSQVLFRSTDWQMVY
jgi:hypothetical protein